MANRDIEIAIKAWDEFSAAMEKGLGSIESSLKSLQEALGVYTGATSIFKELEAATLTAAGGVETLDAKVEIAAGKQAGLFKTMGEAFYFLTQKEEDYNRAIKSFDTWEKDIVTKHKEQFSSLIGIQEVYGASVSSLSAVHTSAYRAMGDEMRRFVETGKFSAKAFGDAVAQQVKTELIGLAARASVWAIYETAMGLKDLAMPGMQAMAVLHFKAAAQFGAVAGASLAGAAGIQASLFGGTDNQPSGGTGGGGAASLGGALLPAGFESGSSHATQNITVHIYNPLSEQNWQKIVEDNIIPAINGASEKNISVVVKTI